MLVRQRTGVHPRAWSSEPEYEEAKEILISKLGSGAATAGLHGSTGENVPTEK